MNKIIVIGGGAAGFFAAIHSKLANPMAEVLLFERSGKVLQKVLISGGGRCNLTHYCLDNSELSENYPRGNKELRQAFNQFSVKDTIQFFDSRGVESKTEKDGRMFPISDSSSSVEQCLINEAKILGVKIFLNTIVENISQINVGLLKYELLLNNGTNIECKKVIICTGGIISEKSMNWITNIPHKITESYPSIFTFFIDDKALKDLSGVSFIAKVNIAGLKYEWIGPILVTHWGLSGPAILRLSSFGAKYLKDNDYKAKLIISFLETTNQNVGLEVINKFKELNPKKLIVNTRILETIPSRLWGYILQFLEISEEVIWNELPKKKINQLAEMLTRWEINIAGKGKFKEEFVQGGGISLKEIDFKTMESKKFKGIYFAGEILDIDGVTGGFNFQAAWTTGFIAGISAGKSSFIDN